MNRSQVIDELKEVCLPPLYEIANELRQKYPQFHISIGHASVGTKTQFQGYTVYLECDHQGSRNPEPNCLAIEATVCNLNEAPTLCSLDVSWGGDGIAPCDSYDCLEEQLPWGDSAKKLIQKSLPTLHQEIDRCLQAWVKEYL
jgi:hypothetical protein